MPKKKGGGLEVLPAGDITTPEGLRAHVAEVNARINELIKREAVGVSVSEDEWATLEQGFNDLAARTKQLDEVVKANAGGPGGARGTELLLDKSMLRLQLPEDMHGGQREYFNLAVLRWDEIAGLSLLGMREAQAVGLANSVARTAASAGSSQLRDLVTRFQNLNDELLVTDTVLAPGASRGGRVDLMARLGRMRSLRLWGEYERVVNALCDAMKVDRAFNEGTSTSGLNWVPTVLSSQLMDLVQLELRVAGLFTPVTMTSKTLDWPVLGSDLVAYLMSEAVADGLDTPIAASTATTNKVTFTATKLGVRTFASSEVIEDSIVPMVSFILGNAAKVLARGIEDAIVNGESGGVTMDGATFNPAGGVRRAWNGLRYFALMTGSYPAKIDMGNAAPSAAKLLDVQLNMGVYGASPAPLAWITGFRGYKGLMKMSEMLTLEKFGPSATILSGQVGTLFGSPVILSEFVTDKNATGVHDAVPANNNRGSILCVHRQTFGVASRRAININGSTDRYIEVDQTVFVGTYRGDFKPFYTPSATVTPVGILYNIA